MWGMSVGNKGFILLFIALNLLLFPAIFKSVKYRECLNVCVCVLKAGNISDFFFKVNLGAQLFDLA